MKAVALVQRAGAQERYKFISPDQLIEDFSADIERWNRENRRT